MLKIEKKSLHSIIHDPTSLHLSESYHHYDNVKSMTINLNEQNQYDVKATLDVLGKISNCELKINRQGEIIDYHCLCPWCSENSACGHIGAVLLKLESLADAEMPFHYVNQKILDKEKDRQLLKKERQDKKKNELLYYGRSIIENQKKAYEMKLSAFSQHQKYELSPFIEYDHAANQLLLSFRVGAQKKYVIKDIDDFLDLVENQGKYKYGKSLEFIHKMDAFDEFSQKQIRLLRKWRDAQYKEYKEHEYYYYDFRVGRYFYLKSNELDDFFALYFEEDVPFDLIKIDRKIKVVVEEIDDMLNFHYEDMSLLSGNSNLYEIKAEVGKPVVLYQIALDDEGKAIQFLENVTSNRIFILKSDYPAFYKYVLSDILPYFDIIGENHLEDIPEPFSIIKLYGDIDEHGQVYIKLNYYNESGDHARGFDENNVTSYTQDLVETYIRSYASVIDLDTHIAYFDENSEDTYIFISDGLPFLNKYCEIYVSEALKSIGKQHNYSIQVGVRIENDLLEVDVNSIEIPKEELSEVLRSYRRKRKFYRLKNGKLLNLNSPQLEELDEMLESYHLSGSDLVDGKTQIGAYRLFSVDEKANQSKYIAIERSEQFKSRVHQFSSKNVKTYPIKKPYDTILRDYQKEGYQWLSLMRDSGFNGILADDMGLGKTLQVIALLDTAQKDKTSIVICPSSLVYNWEDEIHKFSKTLKCMCICGNAKQREAFIHTVNDYDLIITSYDYMRRDVELYEAMTFEYVILDEAQYIKNQKTRNAISVKKLKAVHKLALTGTPIENSLAELWSIFDFLMPDYLFNYHYFQSHYESEIVKNHNEEIQQKLKRLVSPFILRRNKKEVLTELPDKIEKNYLIDFNEEENKLYLAHLAQVNQELNQMAKMENTDKIAILAMLTKLRQLCCEPRLLFENIDQPSSKLKACLDLIQTLKENNQKVLLFSSFTSMLDIIEEELHKEGISYYKLTGSTSKEMRRELVDQFQNDDTSVFLISLKAGGTGLNLTAAEAVIHYDPWWNQSAQNQATDRVHRIGQKKKVQVFKLVMKNSIEEKIQKLQLKKKELADMFVENNEGSLSRMSTDDLMELFKM